MDGQQRYSPQIGLALGSGSARGWSHIGVINALAQMGIEPDIICGCSIGSVVGASYAAGNLAKLEQWVASLTKLDVARLFELDFSLSGFVDTELLRSFLHDYVAEEQLQIDNLAKTFATVSTDLETGREVWFTEGLVNDAVWSSISLPGIFPPVRHRGRWLVDGGLVNPVPVSVCRALGADVVIAVNLNGDIVGKHFYRSPPVESSEENGQQGFAANLSKTFKEYSSALFSSKDNGSKPPGIFEALASSVNITQDRITRSRMAGDPPDIILTPKLSHIGLLEFYRAGEAISEGGACVQRMQSQLQAVLS
ncbi:MAG: patatin-like phospholipase RssA [Desulfuromonas sp.]|nr:patatin-like phospholipase RssA [Desulfuromonas sp.]